MLIQPGPARGRAAARGGGRHGLDHLQHHRHRGGGGGAGGQHRQPAVPVIRGRCAAGQEHDLLLRPCLHQRLDLHGGDRGLRDRAGIHRQAVEDLSGLRHRLDGDPAVRHRGLSPPPASGRQHAGLGAGDGAGRVLSLGDPADRGHRLLAAGLSARGQGDALGSGGLAPGAGGRGMGDGFGAGDHRCGDRGQPADAQHAVGAGAFPYLSDPRRGGDGLRLHGLADPRPAARGDGGHRPRRLHGLHAGGARASC